MYEDMTFENVLNSLLGNVSNEFDKTEGSTIYDALAPCALEIAEMYTNLNRILIETFADTSSREYLIRRAKERGLTPYDSTHAILKAECDNEVPIGSRFSCEDLNYIVISQIDGYTYQLQCETTGVIGNRTFGELLPIEYIKGLTKATLTEVLVPGEDEEDTETFRERYLNSFDTTAFGGNITDYLEKTNSIEGVGSTKVTPVWNGGGTVKLTLLNSEYDICSPELVELVQDAIDPNGGDGEGIAPIGHIVTVESAVRVGINISTHITFSGGYNFEDLESSITKLLNEYLLSIRKQWATDKNSIVRIAQIEAIILNLNGVVDIENTYINGLDKNIVLGEYEVPILDSVINV